MCLVWGSTWYVVREGLAFVPPLGGASLRFFLAWSALTLGAPAIARREGGARPTRGLIVAMGGFNFALTYGFVYWGERYLPSALAAVLWAIYPLLMGIVAHLYVPGERMRRAQWFGVVLGFGGVASLFATDLSALDATHGADAPFGLGLSGVALLFLLAPVACAMGTAYVKRHGAGTSSALLNRDGMLTGALLLMVASLLFERDAEWRFTPRSLACLAYLSLVGTVLAFTLYFWALRHARATQLALMSYVTPAIAVLIGVSVADEPVTGWTLVGLVTILAGVGTSLGRPRQRA